MLPVVEMVLAVAWTFGANGFLIERQWAEVDVLPAVWVEPVAAHTRITFHADPDWAMAHYLPAEEMTVVTGDLRGHYPRPSTLALYAPYYLAPDGLVRVSEMSVDVAEYYFHALIEAAFDHPSDPAYMDWLDGRAHELMSSVPEGHRYSAYTSALADFGAHLLSIRNEIQRLAQRQAGAGGDLCRLIDHPASLFSLWRRSLEEGSYPGSYYAADGSGSSRWLTTRQALERQDKDRFLAAVFGARWTGDPRRDLAAICPSR